MALDTGYFTSTTVTVNEDGIPVGDKAKNAAFFALEKYHLKGNGISLKPTSAFYVAPKSGLIATVSAGWGIMEGYPFHLTEDLDITMTSSVSDQTLYIGVRLDVAGNEYTDDDVVARTTFVAATDRVFAIIVIPANAVTLTAAMITDTRYNATYCGTIDEYNVALEAMVAEYAGELARITAEGLPTHASTHATGQDDALALSSIATTGVDYADGTTISRISGCGIHVGGTVSAQGTPNQTVSVSTAYIITPAGKRYTVNSDAALAATAADATNPRIDIVYITSAGVLTYLAGTAAASPVQPSTPANGTILAAIARAANDNTIAGGDITDKRDFITTANDFEDVTSVTENTNAFACDLAKKHTKNFSFSITNATGKTVTFTSVPYGTCDTILTIKATATAAVTWTLDGRTLAWATGSAPTLTSGYTYVILFSYIPTLEKWVGYPQTGVAN